MMPRSITEYFYDPLRLKFRIKQNEILHFADPYTGHFLYFLKNKNVIVTCHDIYHTVYNDYKGLQNFLYNFSIRGMLKAKYIIADSENTKRDIIKYLRYPSERIKVIPLGVDHNKYKKVAYKADKKNHIILHVGGGGSHKNVHGLIKAFYKLKRKHTNVKMIQAGEPEKVYRDLIRELGLQNDIQFIGFASEKEVIKLYNMADVFVFPSYYEGFGLPPLEAMACGCPVITSNTSSLPEVVGNAGIMLNPNDIEGLANAIYEVLNNEGLREDMIKKGLDRAKLFSWKRTGEETYKVYEEIWNES